MSAPRPTLVMIPGLLCDEAVFAAQLPALEETARVVILTMLDDDSMEGMARRVLAAAPERFALAGFSMGGYVALEVLARAPQRVERVALLDTSAHPDTPERTDLRKKMIELARRGKLANVVALNYPFWVHESRAGDAALALEIREMNDRVGAEAYIRQQTAIMSRTDRRPTLPGIRVPTLVLCGDDDKLTPLAHHREMATAIPDATLVVIPECGHMSTMERPDEVTRALTAWMGS